MKTYEFANALTLMAKILKSMPNQELSDLNLPLGAARSEGVERNEAVVGLHTLANLSKIDKKQWVDLIEEHGFDIPVRPRDASRDIIGKLLRYIDKHESAQQAIKKSAEQSNNKSSKELSRALSILMGGDK
jgi:hypothetical protein